jgi:hypothetical protein
MAVYAGGLIDAADFGTTGGVSVTLSGGVTDAAVTSWLNGGVAGIEFECKFGTVAHNTVIGTVPLGYRPPYQATVVLTPNSTLPASVFLLIATTGVITIFFYGTAAAGSAIRGSASWPRTP